MDAVSIPNLESIARCLTVGWSYIPSSSLYQATIWSGTNTTNLGALWGGESIAYAINDSGDAVGYTKIGRSPSIATIWRGGTPIDVNTLLDPTNARLHLAEARGINDSGQIVGQGTNSWGNSTASCLPLLNVILVQLRCQKRERLPLLASAL